MKVSMTGAVGIFWFVDDVLVAAGCEVDKAEPYGDCMTYDGGHAEHWDSWREAGAGWLSKHHMPLTILNTEYDEHPRGRVVKEPNQYVIYADRRLQTNGRIKQIVSRFALESASLIVRSDAHYR